MIPATSLSSELIVIGGRKHHKECAGMNFDRAVKSANIDYTERCGKCGGSIGVSDEKVVQRGEAVHRRCYNA
jgi:hypothetical protein